MRKTLSFGILLLVIIGLLGCPAPRPDEELKLAKEKLEQAQKEEAPTFAKEDFDRAKKNYIDATNLVEQGKNEDAKKRALVSITNSETAILNSRRVRAQNELTKLDGLIKESSSLRMDVVYPDSYNSYTNSYQVSLDLFNKSNYVESIQNSRKTISEVEVTLKELKDKWNTARTELGRATSRTERLKRIARWLSSEVQEIESLVVEARKLLDEAKLDDSIQKSREANAKLDELTGKLRQRNEQELDNTGSRMKELKINKIQIKFMYFARSIEEIAYSKMVDTDKRIALMYEETAKPTEQKNISQMTDQELEEYKISLESEVSNLAQEIKTLYNQAQQDYTNGNYEDSLEKLDRVNQLLDIYSLKKSEINLVVKEIENRKARVTKETKVTPAPKKVSAYSVKSGDFLSKIAGNLFGGAYWWWPKIFTANRDKIKDPDVIEVGIELVIPAIPEE
ncbi:MAG: LysM peptidoglycan-binding domain-containing protein [Spirochaetia bacterium]|nr:LysM peptidoglycan-binding domain-containing protein [Spirochaetota bacterium]MCX8095936.1 LysM peptidoglycan-binding domain-containing protein [Spirochaetota bacterium]MDW8112228.1 LysM peptidoglycan-binding domain-containing protein [Spirochaetia bacterium]